MSKSNEKKSRQLGMPHGTATHKLRKKIMFHFIQKYEMDICHQCGKKIEKIDSLSIDHKEPWLDSNDPIGLFFDIENIAFSHLGCNSRASRNNGMQKKHPSLHSYQHRGCRCEECTKLQREAQARFRANHCAVV